MTLSLDAETLAELGWGDAIEAERMPSFARSVPKPPQATQANDIRRAQSAELAQ